MTITSPRQTGRRNFAVPPFWDEANDVARNDWLRFMAEAINDLYDGRSNAIGEVTLDLSSTTTTLTDVRIGANSKIFFTPTTEDARSEGVPAVTAKADGSATLGHASDSTTRTYDYIVLGGG
jgi:hypothetical protein